MLEAEQKGDVTNLLGSEVHRGMRHSVSYLEPAV